MILDVHINAILETNIEPFLNKIGATKEALKVLEDKEAKVRADRDAEWEREEQKQITRRKKAKEAIQDDIDKVISQFKLCHNIDQPGRYLTLSFSSDDEIRWRIRQVAIVKGKKLPRTSVSYFSTLNEALGYKSEPDFRWSILHRPIKKGYRLN